MATKMTLRHSFAELFRADDSLDWSSAAVQNLIRSDVVFVTDHDTDELVCVVGRCLFVWLAGKDLKDVPEPDRACIDLDFDTNEFERLIEVLNGLGKICHLRTRADLIADIAERKAIREYLKRRGLDRPASGDADPPKGS
jgi:hypothetical protein